MKGRFIASLCAALALLAACKDEPKPGQLAAKAAEEAYGHLIGGRYADYLGFVAGADRLPADYREQLLANAKQFVAWQEAHGGIDSVRALRAVADTAARRASVYLLLCFGDSTKEEVLVPMVGGPERWQLK